VPSAEIADLYSAQERRVRRAGVPPETRKFTPHVTLARLRDASPLDVADYLASRGAFRSLSFVANRFVLFSSRDSVGGGPYVVEAAYPLG
jgi:2'-5' RNA ligase